MDLKTYIDQVGQKPLARALGVSHKTVSSWRTGRRTPSPHNAILLVVHSNHKLDFEALVLRDCAGDVEANQKKEIMAWAREQLNSPVR